MNSSIKEAVSGLTEIIWLWMVCVLVVLTLPVWFVPYTAYKGWTLRKSK